MYVDFDDLQRKIEAKKDRRQVFAANINMTDRASGRLLWTPEMDSKDLRGPLPGDSAYRKILSKAWQVNSVSDAAERYMIDRSWRGAAAIATIYGGLYNDTPVDSDTESDLTGEPVGNGYARQSWNCNSTDFPSLVEDLNTNWTMVGLEGTFTASGGDIGPVTYFVMQENASATTGDIYIYIALSTTITITDGQDLNVTPALTLA